MPSITSKRRLTIGGVTAGVLSPLVLAMCIGAAALPASDADETPVGCFGFNAATGTIDAYLPFAGPENTVPCPTDVVIPDRIDGVAVTSVGDAAFTGGVITSVEIPDTVTRIGETAFGWLGIDSVVIPDSVTAIGASAFRGNRLSEVVIPDSVTELGEAAFAYNPLSQVTIGSGVTHLPASVFEGGELVEARIPSTVASMDSSAFHSNPITKVTVGDPGYKGDPTLVIPASAFQTGMLAGGGVADLYVGPNVAGIDTLAFFGAPLTGTVEIAEGVTSIGVSAFRGAQLGDLTLPSSVREIGAQAFWEAGLTSITLPTSLTAIGNAALGQNKLTEVTFPDSIETFGDGILQQNPDLHTIHFGTAEYTGDARWTLTGYGKETFGNDGLTAVTFGPVVKSIGDAAFAGNQLTEVVIPGSVTSVGERAFDRGTIATVTVEAGVQAIKADAFAHNPVSDVTIGGNPAMETTAFAYNLAPADVPADLDAGELATFHHENAALVRVRAADKDFAAKLAPGFVHMEKAGKIDLPVYGYVVNPVTYTVEYRDATTKEPVREALVSNVGDGLTGFALSLNPTGDLDRYFRAGQELELEAPAVDGYDTPKARTVTLGADAAENVFAFAYDRSGAWGTTEDPAVADQSAQDEHDSDEDAQQPADRPDTADEAPEAVEPVADAGTVQVVTVSAVAVLAGVAVVWLLSQIRIRRSKGL